MGGRHSGFSRRINAKIRNKFSILKNLSFLYFIWSGMKLTKQIFFCKLYNLRLSLFNISLFDLKDLNASRNNDKKKTSRFHLSNRLDSSSLVHQSMSGNWNNWTCSILIRRWNFFTFSVVYIQIIALIPTQEQNICNSNVQQKVSDYDMRVYKMWL